MRLFVVIEFLSLLLAIPLVQGRDKNDKPSPTKKEAIRILKEFHRSLDANDFEKAVTFVYIPVDIQREKVIESLKGLRKSKFFSLEINAEGIARLEEKGHWGKLTDWLEDPDVQRVTKDRKLVVEQCYGIYWEKGVRRGAAFVWQDNRFHLIYFNNIGYDAPKE